MVQLFIQARSLGVMISQIHHVLDKLNEDICGSNITDKQFNTVCDRQVENLVKMKKRR
jgi:hypothetical protein